MSLNTGSKQCCQYHRTGGSQSVVCSQQCVGSTTTKVLLEKIESVLLHSSMKPLTREWFDNYKQLWAEYPDFMRAAKQQPPEYWEPKVERAMSLQQEGAS